MDDPAPRTTVTAGFARVPAWLRKRGGALFALLAAVATASSVGVSSGLPDLPGDARGFELVPSEHRLRNLVLGPDGAVVGSDGSQVYRIIEHGREVEPIARFPALVNGLHYLHDGTLVVAVDPVPLDPQSPCDIHLLYPDGRQAGPILTLPTATALWWSIASDRDGSLYVGEYGVKRAGYAHRVWKSVNRGGRWEVVFAAPERDGVHIHRVAVDPYTDDVWVTVGDGRHNRGIWRSRDGGGSWTRELDSQATAVVFTPEAIYWGEDFGRGGRISRFERDSGVATEVLDVARHARRGRYGGSIYDMVMTDDGTIYAPTMKYPMQMHTATLWLGSGSNWRLLAELPTGADGAVNAETIAGPDRDGWIHMTGLRFRPL